MKAVKLLTIRTGELGRMTLQSKHQVHALQVHCNFAINRVDLNKAIIMLMHTYTDDL